MTGYLKQFAITPHGNGYRLHIETEEGTAFDVLASFDQLDLIAEEIDRRLDADEEQEMPPGIAG